MPRSCVVNCDDVHTVAISLLDNQVTALSPSKMLALADALRFALDVECD